MFKGETMSETNEMKLEFDSRPCNESFARVAVAAFMTQLNPTLEEVADVKTALSEAVTNAIVHGYQNKVKKIHIECYIQDQVLNVKVTDYGVGMENVELAMQPMYTTRPDEKGPEWDSHLWKPLCGTGGRVSTGKGTTVCMRKK